MLGVFLSGERFRNSWVSDGANSLKSVEINNPLSLLSDFRSNGMLGLVSFIFIPLKMVWFESGLKSEAKFCVKLFLLRVEACVEACLCLNRRSLLLFVGGDMTSGTKLD